MLRTNKTLRLQTPRPTSPSPRKRGSPPSPPTSWAERASDATCSGSSIYAFTFDQPGRYRLAANLASGRGDPKAVRAIEQGMFSALSSTIFGAIVFTVLWQRTKAAKPVATG